MSDRKEKQLNNDDLNEVKSLIGDAKGDDFSLDDILAEFGSGSDLYRTEDLPAEENSPETAPAEAPAQQEASAEPEPHAEPETSAGAELPREPEGLRFTPGADPVDMDFPAEVLYLRVLAANGTGRALLARMRETASVPILTKPADVRLLSPEAQALFALEARATDLYTLAYPDLSAARGGMEWREGPVIL